MTIYSEISDQKDCIVHVAMGQVRIEEAIEAYQEAMQHKDFHKGMSSIWDLTSGSYEGVGEEDFAKLIETIAATDQVRGEGRKVALVVKNMVDLGLGKLFEEMSKNRIMHQERIFLKMEDALAWLRE